MPDLLFGFCSGDMALGGVSALQCLGCMGVYRCMAVETQNDHWNKIRLWYQCRRVCVDVGHHMHIHSPQSIVYHCL